MSDMKDGVGTYLTEAEAKEFHGAQQEKRKPDARRFPWLP